MIRVLCPQCRAQLAVDDDRVGQALACPDCGNEFRVPLDESHLIQEPDFYPPPRITARVFVRLMSEGRWQAFDASPPIFVDGKPILLGSIKEGFDAVVRLSAGAHTLAIGPSEHPFDLPNAGFYELEFDYGSASDPEAREPRLRYVGDEEPSDWPAHDVTPGEEPDVTPSLEDWPVLAALEQLRNQKPGYMGAIAVLIISLVLYMAAAKTQQIWDSIFILIPVLAFHEAGHYFAMRIFGYRNLRMFFIPFFGAAVTGQHYNIEGWKKSVVALAGPLPGIALAVPIGAVGLYLKQQWIVDVSLLMLILNGFNLLPFLPMDGGWVVHAILFVRHPLLDLTFRLIAALMMLGLGILLKYDWCLIALGVFMLLATPMAFRQARIAYRLRQEGLVARSIDAHTIPTATALQILAEVRRSLPRQTSPGILAQHVAQVFESCNAEPPGILGSILLLGAQGIGFVVALAMAIVVTVLRHQG